MHVDIEETLSQELREVADGLEIPPRPPVEQKAPRSRRSWQPMLVAAALVLVVAGTIAVLLSRGGNEPQPAPAPRPDRSDSVVRVPTGAPTVPFVLDQALYVDGKRVPGDWWNVWSGERGWLGQRTDDTWWWGSGAEPHRIEGVHDQPPVLSPNGQYAAYTGTDAGRTFVTGFDMRPDGEGFGAVPVTEGSRVVAVTDDGRVIAQGPGTDLLWLPLVDQSPVDLSTTAPDRVVLGSTPSGLLVNSGTIGEVDGTSGAPYLAEVADDGTLTRVAPVPVHDLLLVSPGGERVAWVEPGTLGGEVMSFRSFEVQALDGSGRATLQAPEGWGFKVHAWAWEDDDLLVSPVLRQSDGRERMVRCSLPASRCALVDAP